MFSTSLLPCFHMWPYLGLLDNFPCCFTLIGDAGTTQSQDCSLEASASYIQRNQSPCRLLLLAIPWRTVKWQTRIIAILYLSVLLIYLDVVGMSLMARPCPIVALVCRGDFFQLILWQLVGTLGNWPLAESAMVSWLAQWW